MAEIVTKKDTVALIRSAYCDDCKTGCCDVCYVTDMLYDAIDKGEDPNGPNDQTRFPR